MQLGIHQLYYALRHLLHAHSNGHGVHSPLAYDLCVALSATKRNAELQCQNLKALRFKLKSDSQVLQDGGYGAGSKVFKSEFRAVKHITRWGISSHSKARILFQLIRFFNPERVLELGTSIGLTTLYLASAQYPRPVHSVEANAAYFEFAKRLHAQHISKLNILFFHSTFETFLNANPDVYDFIFIDGAHDYHTTVKLFEYFNLHQGPRQVLVFDDIYWSPQMTKAWKHITENATGHLVLDAFSIGIVIKNDNLRTGYRYHIKLT